MIRDPNIRKRLLYKEPQAEYGDCILNFMSCCSENEDDIKESFRVASRTFPWLHRFIQLALKYFGSKDVKVLEWLIFYFIREVSICMEECNTRPVRAAKLKLVVKKMLVFFHLIRANIGLEGRALKESAYLDLMSDLVAMYIDLETRSVQRGVDNLMETVNTMTSVINFFLDASEDHISEAFLKAKNITKSNGEICCPILNKFLKEGKFIIKDESNYLRFLFTFKLLKSILRYPPDKILVNRLAVLKLKPNLQIANYVRSSDWISPLLGKLESKMNITFALMNLKFDLLNAKRSFFRRYGLSKKYYLEPLAGNIFIQTNIASDLLFESESTNKIFKGKAFSKFWDTFKTLHHNLNNNNNNSNLKLYGEKEVILKKKNNNFDDYKFVEFSKSLVSTDPVEEPEDTDEEEKKWMSDQLDFYEDQTEGNSRKTEVVTLVNVSKANKNILNNLTRVLCIHYCSTECNKGAKFAAIKGQIDPRMLVKSNIITDKTKNENLKKVESCSNNIKQVKFESISKCYKVVKSRALKIGTLNKSKTVSQNKMEQSERLKQFDFSSKIVGITEEEFNGRKPKRCKSWRSERRERLEMEKNREDKVTEVNLQYTQKINSLNPSDQPSVSVFHKAESTLHEELDLVPESSTDETTAATGSFDSHEHFLKFDESIVDELAREMSREINNFSPIPTTPSLETLSSTSVENDFADSLSSIDSQQYCHSFSGAHNFLSNPEFSLENLFEFELEHLKNLDDIEIDLNNFISESDHPLV